MIRNVLISFSNVVKRMIHVIDVMQNTMSVPSATSNQSLVQNAILSKVYPMNVSIVKLLSVIHFVRYVKSGHQLIFSIVKGVAFVELD